MTLLVRKRKIMNPIQFEKYGTEHGSHMLWRFTSDNILEPTKTRQLTDSSLLVKWTKVSNKESINKKF